MPHNGSGPSLAEKTLKQIIPTKYDDDCDRESPTAT